MQSTLEMALDLVVDQAVFARAVGVSEARVSQLVADGVLRRGEPARLWLQAYCERLREQAAGRGQELTMERAALARSQRIGQDLKNAVTQREYAPIGLLADVLAAASSAMVDRLDALSGTLARKCPQLDDESRTEVLKVIADARNEWVRQTASLAVEIVDELSEDADEEAAAAVDVPPADLGDDEP